MIKYFGDCEKEYKDPICATLGCNHVPDEDEEYCEICQIRHKSENEDAE